MNKSKIIYIGPFEMPNINAAANRVKGVAKIFEKIGFETEFIEITKKIGGRKISDEFEKNLVSKKIISKYPIHQIAKYLFGSFEIDNYLISENNKNSIAVVCYNYPAFALLRIIILGKIFGFKVLSDTTEWYESNSKNIFYKIIKELDTNLRIRLFNKFCDGIIVISPTLKKYYENSRNFSILIPPIFCKNELPYNNKINNLKSFVYMGSPFQQNMKNSSIKGQEKDNLHLIVEAFFVAAENGKRFLFTVGGLTKENYLSAYPSDIDKIKKIGDQIQFKGRVPHKEATKIISNHDFTVFFRGEKKINIFGFPSKLAESISIGTPVITNYLPNLVDIKEKDWLIKTEEKNFQEILNEILDPKSTDKLVKAKKSASDEKYFEPDIYKAELKNFATKINLFTK